MSNHEITLEDIGPIHDLRIQVSESGGVYVLLGANGTGKTTAINAVQALASGSGRIEQRDGAARGEVNAFGATLRVSRRLSRAGELEVNSLEGRFSISDLVDPKIKGAEEADTKRIKALIQLSGNATANANLFYDLVGGQESFDALIDKQSIETDDLVTMASRIKRDLEAHSRRLAADAERDFTKAESSRLSAAGVDTNLPHDANELQAALSIADREDARLNAEAKAAIDSEANIATARKALADAHTSYTGPTYAESEVTLFEASKAHTNASGKVRELEQALKEARHAENMAKLTLDNASRTSELARSHAKAIEGFESIIFAPVGEQPSPQDLANAQTRLLAARRAVEEGTLVRKAISDLENASKLKSSALAAQKEADRLRDAAKATDDVLSKAVQSLGCPLRVSHSRLVTDTDRGEELFADLSEGEKYSIAIPIAVEAVGKGGLITLSQEAWQGLDPTNKQLVASKVEGTGVILLTAQATDDAELRAEYYDPFTLGE